MSTVIKISDHFETRYRAAHDRWTRAAEACSHLDQTDSWHRGQPCCVELTRAHDEMDRAQRLMFKARKTR